MEKSKGPFKCYVMQMEVSNFMLNINVISVTRGWWGSNFPEKNFT